VPHKLLEINIYCRARRRDYVFFFFSVFIMTTQSLRESISAVSRYHRILHLQSMSNAFQIAQACNIYKIALGFTRTREYSSLHDWYENLWVYGILES